MILCSYFLWFTHFSYFRMSVVLSEFTQQFSHLFSNSVDYVKNLQSPRFIKSHLPFQLLPKEINKVKPKVKNIYYHYANKQNYNWFFNVGMIKLNIQYTRKYKLVQVNSPGIDYNLFFLCKRVDPILNKVILFIFPIKHRTRISMILLFHLQSIVFVEPNRMYTWLCCMVFDI